MVEACRALLLEPGSFRVNNIDIPTATVLVVLVLHQYYSNPTYAQAPLTNSESQVVVRRYCEPLAAAATSVNQHIPLQQQFSPVASKGLAVRVYADRSAIHHASPSDHAFTHPAP